MSFRSTSWRCAAVAASAVWLSLHPAAAPSAQTPEEMLDFALRMQMKQLQGQNTLQEQLDYLQRLQGRGSSAGLRFAEPDYRTAPGGGAYSQNAGGRAWRGSECIEDSTGEATKCP